jgi:hypothetical protein
LEAALFLVGMRDISGWLQTQPAIIHRRYAGESLLAQLWAGQRLRAIQCQAAPSRQGPGVRRQRWCRFPREH